ncbi:MAG: hypothetical protein LOY00_05305 [Methylocaldum sp.]|nr:hypothetical protein [Methylocaldum sp.]
MGIGGTFAIVTFTAGVLCLLGWLYATTDNPRSWAMLKKSSLLFALPIMFSPAQLFQFPLGMWALVAFEEGLKAFASTREDSRENKFWLVALFGIWELTVDKPFWGLVLAQSGETWDRLSLIGLAYATALPVLMHAVTAAIYAFTFERKIWAAFIASWMVHTAFNESVDYFGLSPMAAITQTAILTILLVALFAMRRKVPIRACP